MVFRGEVYDIVTILSAITVFIPASLLAGCLRVIDFMPSVTFYTYRFVNRSEF